MAEENELSREEYIARRQELQSHYTEEVEFLKIQKEYESLLTEIDELRAKRIFNQVRISQLMAGPESEPEEERPTKSRKLKTTE